MTLTLAKALVPPVQFETDLPGVGILDQRLMIALPISDDGTVSAGNVQVTGVTFGSAPLISPVRVDLLPGSSTITFEELAMGPSQLGS